MMKRIRLELSLGTQNGGDFRHVMLSENEITELAPATHGHQLGKFRETSPVIVEGMYYEDSWETIPVSERTVAMGLKAQGFGVLHKPRNLRTLHCLGFFEQDKSEKVGFGFVYQIPTPASPHGLEDIKLTTLNTLLRRSAAETSAIDTNLSQPLLGDKYLLACKLAESLHDLHTIGWLHENMHSGNIVFFDDSLQEQCINPNNSNAILEPYVVGLAKSRPGGELWHTQGPSVTTADFQHYVHPDYEITRRFRVNYDYYTLGVMLLEIGLWIPLAAWSAKYPSLKPHQFRDTLVEKYVPRLGPRMGRKYRDVVKALLTDTLDPSPRQKQSEPENEQKVCNRYFENVLMPLQDILEAPL